MPSTLFAISVAGANVGGAGGGLATGSPAPPAVSLLPVSSPPLLRPTPRPTPRAMVSAAATHATMMHLLLLVARPSAGGRFAEEERLKLQQEEGVAKTRRLVGWLLSRQHWRRGGGTGWSAHLLIPRALHLHLERV